MARHKMINDDKKSSFLGVAWFGEQVTPGRTLDYHWWSLKELFLWASLPPSPPALHGR